jgi:hypothetical protein
LLSDDRRHKEEREGEHCRNDSMVPHDTDSLRGYPRSGSATEGTEVLPRTIEAWVERVLRVSQAWSATNL